MMNLNLSFVASGLLLSVAAGQYVVTVSRGTCLPELGSMSFISPGGPGPSAIPAGPGIMSTKPESNTTLSAPNGAISTASPTPPGFLISYTPVGSALLRRDTARFLTLDDRSTNACIHSPLFNLSEAGQLTVVNAGTPMTYSTSAGEISAPFAPSGSIGDISTSWQFVGGTLLWNNSSFLNGTAAVCSDPTGAIYAYFWAPLPANCTAISLAQTPVSACPGYFQANPNGLLAPFPISSFSLPSSTLSSTTSLVTSQSITPSVTTSTSTSVVSSQSTSLTSSEISSTSAITSQTLGPSSFNLSSLLVAPSSSLASTTSIGLSIPTPPSSSTPSSTSSMVPSFSTSTIPVITSSSPVVLNSTLPGTLNSTKTPFSISVPSIPSSSSLSLAASSSLSSSPTSVSRNLTTTLPFLTLISTTKQPTTRIASISAIFSANSTFSLPLRSSSSSSSSPSSSPSSSSSSTLLPLPLPTRSPSPSSSSSSSSSSSPSSSSSSTVLPLPLPTPSPSPSSSSSSIQATITSTVTSGSSLYTTFLDTASQTVVEEIVQPTPFTTTIYSGSSSYTSSTILPDGQEEVVIVDPLTTTTTTSYTATTTIYTTTNTGASGQVTVLVVQPTPGMQYFGFQDPSDNVRGTQPDSSRFNNNATDIDVDGVFPADINFYTDPNGFYQFPGQNSSTNAANYAVVFEGYFYGPPGNYTVALNQGTDDYSFLWTDSNAYSAWSNNNAEITEKTGGNGYTQNHSFALAENQFVPMTVLWVNVYLSGDTDFVIYPPEGGSVTDTTGYFVQPYAGDGFVYHAPTS